MKPLGEEEELPESANVFVEGRKRRRLLVNGSLDSEVIRRQLGVIDLQHQPGVLQRPLPHLPQIRALMELRRTPRRHRRNIRRIPAG